MADTYRAGAIGRTGRGNFGHGLHKCYASVEGVDLIAVADEDAEGLAKAREETGAEQAYSDYREMLAKADLDIVSVCPRWVDCHGEMITAALEAGCHVYSEKPMTATPAAADRLIDLADSKGLKIAVAHQAAYLPQIKAIQKEISAGRIGKVVSVHASGKQDHRGGGEDLIVLGTHLFNLMRIFFGDPRSVMGQVTVDDRPLRKEDVREAGEPVGPIAGDALHGLYVFEGGITAEFVSRRREIRDGRPYGMEIRGEKAAIAFNAAGAQVSILEDDAIAPWDAEQSRTACTYDTAPLMAGNDLAIQDLLSAIKANRDPLSSARGARVALEMILGIYASEISGERVSFPLSDRRHPLDVWKNSA
jgi:predicted dehydrogenase